MTLYHSGSGLLGTHVTWQDVESEMQNALGTVEKFGQNKETKNINYLKNSNFRIALVYPDWSQDLPQYFVVKIASQLNSVIKSAVLECPDILLGFEEKFEKLETTVKLLHNREVDILNSLSTIKHEMGKIVPKIYSTKKFDEKNKLKGYIMSEYKQHNHENLNDEPIEMEDLKQVVRSAAAFSAIGEKVDKEEMKFTEILDVILGEYFNEKVWERSQHVIRRFFPSKLSSKVEEMLKIYNDYYLRPGMLENYKNMPIFLVNLKPGHKPVLVHGNLCNSNLQWDTDCENGKRIFVGISHYQTVSFTSPGLDISRLFVSCLGKKDRSGKKLEELLKLYYNTFVEELQGKPVPYTFQQVII